MTPPMIHPTMMSETLAETLHAQPGPVVLPLQRRLAGLVGGAVALSVVLASALPVRANDNDDLVAALAALALLGVIINEADKDEPSHDTPSQDYPYQPPRPTPYPSHAYPPRGVSLPAACAIEIETRDRRDIVVYTERCLEDYGIRRLPDACAREIKVGGRREWIFGQACLRDAGYRFESTEHRYHERPD